MHSYPTRFAHLNRSIGSSSSVDATYVPPSSAMKRWNPDAVERRVTRSMAAASLTSAAAPSTRHMTTRSQRR
jgi:hypothetical protein